MLEIALTVRDENGRVVDPADLGVDALVQLIRRRPKVDEAVPPDDRTLDLAFQGPALLGLIAAEQLCRQAAALKAACVAAVADETPWGAAGDQVVDEVSAALVVSRRSALATRATAETLRHQPAVWAALSRSEIDGTRARILADALFEVPRTDDDGVVLEGYDERCRTLLGEGLAYAAEHTARRLDLFLRRRLATLGCPDRPRRRARALAGRGVWLAHRGDGTADLIARLASADAERVYAAVRTCALADRNGDPAHDHAEPREPLDLWLAAAFVDLVLGPAGSRADDARGHRADGPDLGGRRRVQVDTTIVVTIAIESLVGLSDEPAMINGFGVIPAEDARLLAAGDARWRQVLTSRITGAVLDVGQLSYRPPAALARHVRLRDGTCRFPGCEVPARECDLDHLIPFPSGPTSESNLFALCRRHHGLKHEGGWQVAALPGSALKWDSPQGASTITHPDDTGLRVA